MEKINEIYTPERKKIIDIRLGVAVPIFHSKYMTERNARIESLADTILNRTPNTPCIVNKSSGLHYTQYTRIVPNE
jgi:hypothetical protein